MTQRDREQQQRSDGAIVQGAPMEFPHRAPSTIFALHSLLLMSRASCRDGAVEQPPTRRRRRLLCFFCC